MRNKKYVALAIIIATTYNTSVKSESVELAKAAKFALADMEDEL